MELMEKEKIGFKKTEVGLIPEDWNIHFLIQVVNGITDVDHYMPPTRKVGIPYVMTGDLKELVSDIDFDSCKKISSGDYKKLSKKNKNLKGNIVLARYATIGTVSYVDIDKDFIISYSCVTIKPNETNLNGLFFFYYLKSNIFKNEAYNKINSNIQGNIGISDLYKFKIPLPPNLEEQKAIATALGDTDVLIAGLEKLITKKKAIKQGAMQQLLTPPQKGGKRLPEFSGEWEEKRLDFLAKIVGGGTPSTSIDKFWSGNINWFTPTEIGKRKYAYTSYRKITEEGLDNCSARILPEGTILMTSRASIGDLSILKNIPLFATDAFYFNNNQPIKAIGKLYFVKIATKIETQKLEKAPDGGFELKSVLEYDKFNENTTPLYGIGAVG